MENFNKNWLAILLIAFVFCAIGFMFGWICNSCQSGRSHMFQKEIMIGSPEDGYMKNTTNCCPGGMGNVKCKKITCGGEGDSLKVIDVQVQVGDQE
jgi:hypothetical protein